MKEKIFEFLYEVRPECDFRQSTNFIEEGLLDSFDIVSLVVSLDKEFDISIDGVDILPENFSSVESIAGLLVDKGAIQ